jgi:quinol monooxygenase YgiN
MPSNAANMNRIIIRGEFPFREVRIESLRQAIATLRSRVLLEHAGVILYEFFINTDKPQLAILEIYSSQDALLNHIEASDFSTLFENIDLNAGKIQVHGELSGKLANVLSQFGHYDHFAPI